MQKVSIIIPLYNVEKFVRFALESAIAQTYSNIEILIVDDGSSDRSVDICQQFDDSRIRIIQQQNRGLSGARNTGIRHAKGDYVAFLDADDLWVPEKVEKHVRHLEAATDVGASFSYSKFIDERGNPLGLLQFAKTTDITPLDILCRSPIGNGSAAIFRKQMFDDIAFEVKREGAIAYDYFDEQFRESQDVECWMRVAIQTDWKIEGIPELLTLYRINSQGISANIEKKLNAWDRLIERIYTYAPEQMAIWEGPARAYHFRHLARRAVTLRDKKQALSLFVQSLQSHWRILVEEPFRTGLTGAAATALWLLPQTLYSSLLKLSVQLAGRSQKRHVISSH
ncbi:MAG: glucosyl transferase [Leptolyngbya foveolarum]|uniref:Glucosyl transferase n=1 Tax=Leptolyngbya foveolarum TaxID=47253 RepID=A0A2W4WHC2_9CYAN|nr:MAG: glucosyl transferase [Leptolyngbya foveolarum]